MNQYCDRLVCPTPDAWAAVHRRLLKARQRAGDPAIPEPPCPLILDGWAFSSDTQKQERWAETVRWATQHGFNRLIPTIARRNAYQGSGASADVVTREQAIPPTARRSAVELLKQLLPKAPLAP